MGDKIIGEFIKDKIYGKVIISHKNGDLYEGDCLQFKKNGYGVYIWLNGDKYEGHFKDDFRHGVG